MALLLFSNFSEASFRFGGGVGYGVAAVSGTKGSNTEGPGGLDFFVDYPLNPTLMIGAEHVRSIESQPAGSGVGFTGILAKWYFMEPISQSYLQDTTNRDEVFRKSWAPYIGTSFGMAQASVASDTTSGDFISAIGFYGSIKGGIECPVWQNWGFRFESNYVQTLSGTGTIKAMNFLFGGYVYF